MLTLSLEQYRISTMKEETSSKNPNIPMRRILSEVVIDQLKEIDVEESLIIALMNEHADAVELLKAALPSRTG